MRILLVLLFLSATTVCFSDTKVFYDPSSGKEIVDLSGKKTREQIIDEFQTSDNIEFITLNQGDGHRLENNSLVKYDIQQELEQKKTEKENERKDKENRIKQKLGLSASEFKDLKEAIND